MPKASGLRTWVVLLLASVGVLTVSVQGAYAAAPVPEPAATVPGTPIVSTQSSARIVLPTGGTVATRVVGKEAGDVLAFGLAAPDRVVVCEDCTVYAAKQLGSFPAGTELVFFLRDRTAGLTWQSTNAKHARVRSVTPDRWQIRWDDSGGCNPACPDGDFNDLVVTITLSSP